MQRLKKLISRLPEDCDGIFVTDELNIRYLCGFAYSDGYILVTRKKSYVLTDFRYAEAAKNSVDPHFEIAVLKGLSDGKTAALMKQNGVSRLMYEDHRLTCADFEKLKKSFSDIEFIPAGRLLEDMRETKYSYEVECITKAQRIAEKSLEQLLGIISPDMTETEVALELEYLMRKNGSSDRSFDTIAVSGKASSLPHGVPRDRKLEKGFLTIDFGAIYNGYHSDMTRTFCIGRADSEMKKVYDAVLNAQQAAIEAIINGERNCVKIYKIARDIIYGAGYEGCFGHGLGHGVGLEIHETPLLSPSYPKDKELVSGNIVTVEPGIYIEGKYGVRIEDMMHICENGAVDLTHFDRHLTEI